MKLSGNAVLHAPAEQIFNSMQDPRFLVRTIPGCRQLEVVGPDEYQMTINAGVASIKGTYLGNVRMLDPVPPQAYTLRASAQSAVGTVDADARIRLEDLGGGSTELRYDADAAIGGTIAGVGQRVLTGVARKMADEFFAAVDRELTVGETALAMPAMPFAEGVPIAAPVAAPPQAGAAASAEVAGPPPSAAAAGAAAAPAAAAAPRLGEVFRRPPPPPAPPAAAWWVGLAGAAVGAVIALIGVALGARAARRG